MTRAEARGHPSPSKRSAKAQKPKADAKINVAIRAMHEGSSLTAAARAAHVSPERLRHFIKANKIAKRDGCAWKMTDNRVRRVPIIKGSDSKVKHGEMKLTRR